MMKLRYSPTSPYVRKVSVVAIETGLAERIERVPTDTWGAPSADFHRDNPLGKVPTLITEGGEALYDSPVVCEYLDSLHDGIPLFPPPGGPRWTALRRQALADGIADAAVMVRVERLRPLGEQSAAWIDRQKAAVNRSLDALEEEATAFGSACTIGHIAIGCALGFLAFRLPDLEWRKGRIELARWAETFFARPSMAATTPREPT